MDRETLKRTIREYDFRPKKRLGQNFLVNPSIARRMMDAIPKNAASLIEIGGGFGALTRLLAGRGAPLFVFEPDPILSRYLSETFRESEGVIVEKKDILTVFFQDYLRAPAQKLSVIGNLPYAITSPILIHLVRERAFLEEALVTVQKEVASRLVAKPKTKSYSPLSCLLQCHVEVKALFRIPRSAFYPQPEVDSEVLRLRFLEKPRVSPKDLDFMFRVIRTGFGKRRKMLVNALTDLGPAYSKERIRGALGTLRLSNRARAEELALEEFARLSDILLI